MREQIVARARQYIGAPYVHHGDTRHGMDCVGLVKRVVSDLGLVDQEPASWPEWHRFSGYSRQPDGRSLMEALRLYFDQVPLGEMRPGDVIAMKFSEYPQHIGWLADYRHGGLSVVHALQQSGRVCEHRLDRLWRSRVVAAFEVRS